MSTLTDFELVAASAVSPERLHAAFVAAFADYLAGPFTLPEAEWVAFITRQAIALDQSRIALRHGDVVAFAYFGARPEQATWRLAAMGAVPATRGTGIARGLLTDGLRRAKAAGFSAMELEVFAQNQPALKLYADHGFSVRHELQAFRWDGLDRGADVQSPAALTEPCTERALPEAWSWIARSKLTDLPLQVTGTALRASPHDLQAWACGTAQLVFAVPAAGPVLIASLIDTTPSQGDALRLIEELLARFRGRMVRVPPLQRADLGGLALRRAGFTTEPLHQLLMVSPV